jgi:hypothetical protein
MTLTDISNILGSEELYAEWIKISGDPDVLGYLISKFGKEGYEEAGLAIKILGDNLKLLDDFDFNKLYALARSGLDVRELSDLITSEGKERLDKIIDKLLDLKDLRGFVRAVLRDWDNIVDWDTVEADFDDVVFLHGQGLPVANPITLFRFAERKLGLKLTDENIALFVDFIKSYSYDLLQYLYEQGVDLNLLLSKSKMQDKVVMKLLRHLLKLRLKK